MLFIAVVGSFAYRRLKQERSKQGGGGGSRGGGVGSQNRADVDLLVAINSSTPRVTRWVERGLIFNLVLNNIVLCRRAPPPPYSEVPTQPSAPDYNQQVYTFDSMYVDMVKYDKHYKIHRCEQKGSVDISSSFSSVRGRFLTSDKYNSNCVFTPSYYYLK